ncbi:hypothetical protein [Nocardioides flavescens]|uniref:Uncharacterized protein n=1 Tax=Nocardioides flavescens TaxID=2691959 RepID=A0A6L7ERY2_9ACTN|nr:hypothetical protein [Nocardioides flavescens]MXG88306.1 hypothetical protein [Nocardioides flavescens]
MLHPRSRTSRRCAVAATVLALSTAAVAAPSTAAPATSGQSAVVVAAGQTWTVTRTTRLRSLTIRPGGQVVAPAGSSLTLTVDGVETGGVIESTGGEETVLRPGTYRGDVVLTVTGQNLVAWQGLTFPLRQALYVDGDGVDGSLSVPAAVSGRVTDSAATGLRVRSTGENFNGVYVAGGSYTLDRPDVSLTGNGRSDFVGYGAAVTATGGARLVVDDARITGHGAARTGVVADGGSNVIVKDSTIHTEDGTLPADYQSTVELAYMQQAPWMLGIVGNVRATNLLGDGTRATYVDSDISSEGWGVLSADVGSDGKLTAINSRVSTTGDEGYGSYAIGGTTEEFLGTRFDVDTYAAINRGGAIHYGDSDRASVAALNTSLDLRLSQRELRALDRRRTVIDSDRWGVMWHGSGSVSIDGGTQVRTGRATFLDKGQAVDVTVDGSDGAKLLPADGTLFQLMEDDDPGPVVVDGKLVNTGVYHEPTGEPTKVADFDVTAVHDDDAVLDLRDIDLTGNLYNGLRGNNPDGPFGPGVKGKNLVLTLTDATLRGAVTATRTRHRQDTITAADYRELGVVTNTPSPVVNNGVIVTLAGRTTWTPTGTSYLSKLTVGSRASVRGATLTVDGVATPLQAGRTYTGALVLTAR